MGHSSCRMSLLLLITAFLLCIHSTFEQSQDIQGGSFEVREHSLNRPYPAGLTRISFMIRILNKDFF